MKPRQKSERSSSEPLAEVQRALLVVLVLHAPHPEAGGLLGLRKLREHCKSVEKGVRYRTLQLASKMMRTKQGKQTKLKCRQGCAPFELHHFLMATFFCNSHNHPPMIPSCRRRLRGREAAGSDGGERAQARLAYSRGSWCCIIVKGQVAQALGRCY